MTCLDSARLARIRADAEKWIAIYPAAANWDSAFLLRLLDERKQEVPCSEG